MLDLHSYNHRRDGPTAPPAPIDQNPEVNVGTGTVDRERWGPVVDRLMSELADREVAGHRLDVRENVRFMGGYLTQWVNERYDGVGLALAIELKKVFMDEWTGIPDDDHLRHLTEALGAAVPAAVQELGSVVP